MVRKATKTDLKILADLAVQLWKIGRCGKLILNIKGLQKKNWIFLLL